MKDILHRFQLLDSNVQDLNPKKSISVFVCFIVAMFSFMQINAQVIFYEGFQQGIPNTFTLVNADGNTPATQVSFVTNAWVAEEYNNITNDSAAVSTSWYTTPATADDWMITPAISLTGNATLSWKAFASDPDFRDGYEVRISTTGNSVGNFTTILFSTGAEQTTPIIRTADLTSYNGQTVYIAYRNNSFNKNLLFIDDIKVELKPDFDLGIQSSTRPTPYTLIPRSQQKLFTPSATVKNEGTTALTNSKVFAAILKNNQLLKLDSITIATLASGLVSTVSFPSFTTTDSGSYQLIYFTRIPQIDGNTLNDTARFNFMVTDSIYARDNGIVSSTTSIGASSGEFGHTFEILNTAKVKSATAYLNNPSIGAVTKFRLYDFTTSPAQIVDSTSSYVTTLSDSLNGKTLVLNFIGNTSLQAGKYLLAIVEQGNKKLNVGTTEEVQSPKANWYRFFGNPFFRWASGEEYDSLSGTQAYTKVLALRLNLEDACSIQPNFGMVTKSTCTNTGSISLNYTSLNASPYQYRWSGNQTSSSISNLLPGIYSVTVTDAFGCKFAKTDTVKNIPISLSIQVNDVGCKGGNNGTATANASGGNGSYTYVWNTVPQQVGKTATGLKQGVYTVTVTDGSCVTTSIAPVLEPSTAMVVSITQKVNPSTANANDGSITVNANGGQLPYLYVWNDSTVSQSISNLAAGKYCVTVTDGRNCVVEKCDTIGIGVYLNDVDVQALQVYPQPAQSTLFVETTLQNFSYTLLSISGAVVASGNNQNNATNIDVADLSSGVYLLQILHSNGVLQKRVLVSR